MLIALSIPVLAACSPDQSAPPELVDIVADLEDPPIELELATQIVQADCLRKAGFDVPRAAAMARPVHSEVYLGLVGVFRSEEQAASLGYASTVRGDAGLDQFEESLPESRREAFRTALNGPEGAEQISGETSDGMQISRSAVGCAAEADKAVYGSLADDMEGSLLRNEALGATKGQATDLGPQDGQRYTECMRAAGYTVDGFNAFDVAAEEFGIYRTPADPPHDDEKAMAVADYNCQQQVDLVSRMRDNYAKRAGDWVVANESRLLEWKSVVEASLKRAKVIIDG